MSVRTAILVLVFATLQACSSNPTPPPVADISSQAPIERTTESSDPQQRTPATHEATTLLLAQATAAETANEHANARVYIERAIRLEPRNSELWTALAKSHLQSGDFVAANQHVRKAIALAGRDAHLERFAWLTLADIREAEGQKSEANSIRRRYGTTSG